MTVSPSVPSVASTRRWAAVVPSWTTATGVSASRPPRTRAAAMAPLFSTPMRITRVPRSLASADQSTVERSSSGATWPLTTVNSWATPRCVTGMPTAPGTLMELEMPGTTVHGMPCSASAAASSMPRPKTKGSPPLRRTTAFPALACSMSALLMASWAMKRPYGILAASMTSTCGGSSSSRSRGPSRSAMTTSASASSRRPRTVIRSGSPGPPPTRATPVVRARWCGAGSVPSRSPSMIASRTAAERRGSRPVRTATVTPSLRPVAGVQADAASASSLRTHHTRRASASADAAALTSGSSVLMSAYQASAKSPSR